MGVDTIVTLPAQVRVRDVAKVISILLGNEKNVEKIGSSNQFEVAYPPVEIKDAYPGSALIEVSCANAPKIADVNGSGKRVISYHYEWGDGSKRGVLLASTASSIALGVALVNFFGGSVNFNDCDDVDVDYKQPTRSDVRSKKDSAFINLKKRIIALQPLTEEQILIHEKKAAYKST